MGFLFLIYWSHCNDVANLSVWADKLMQPAVSHTLAILWLLGVTLMRMSRCFCPPDNHCCEMPILWPFLISAVVS